MAFIQKGGLSDETKYNMIGFIFMLAVMFGILGAAGVL
jgi:hypothetical protein